MSKFKAQRYPQHERRPELRTVDVKTVASIERALRGRIEKLEAELAKANARIVDLEDEA